jgi:hypothetical protein
MPESLADQIVRLLPDATGLYNRLLLVVTPSGGGKTAALQEVTRRTGSPLLNLNLELSRLLLDLTIRQRCLQVPRLLDEIVQAQSGEVVLLDNTEILFDVQLRQDPLRCLQGLSRHRTVVAAWSGSCGPCDHPQRLLSYAQPDHPEYRRYPASELLVISAPAA